MVLLVVLNSNGVLVKSTAEELNKLNRTSADGVVENSKAVVVDNNKDLSGLNKLSIQSLNINGSDLISSAEELNRLSGVTPGTAVANKALIVDDNKDIDSIRNINNLSQLETDNLVINNQVSMGDINSKSDGGAVVNIQNASVNIAKDDVLGQIQFKTPDESSGGVVVRYSCICKSCIRRNI